MALADLMTPGSLHHGVGVEPEGELDDEELQILKDAGIISRPSKGKGKGRRKPKHIVFVDNEDEGTSIHSPSLE